MAKEKDPNKKHYFDKITVDEIKKSADQLISSSEEVVIWEQGKNEEHVEKFVCKSYDDQTNTFYLEQIKEGLLSSFMKSKYIDKEIFLRIGSGREQIFTTSSLKLHSQTGQYSVTFKNTIFKSLQRQNYRLNADDHNKIQVKLDDDLIFDGLDISAGGMSFQISDEELENYPKGKTFKSCTIRFNKEKYGIDEITVAGSWPIKKSVEEDPDLHKIGLSFSKMNPDIEEKLFKNINSVARIQEMTKSLLNK